MARAETGIAQHDTASATPTITPLTWLRLNAGRGLLLVVLLVFGLIFVFPFYWVLTASIKETAEIRAIPPTFWPQSFTLDAYTKVWSAKFARYFVNSFVYAGAITIIDVVTSTLIGFVLIKHPSRLGTIVFWTIISATMVPFVTYLLPLFKLLIWLQEVTSVPLINTYLGMVLPWMISPFGVFLMRQAMFSVPNDLLDAARIDGASDWTIFWRIVVPLVKQNMAALALLVFIFRYEDLLWPLVVAQRTDMYPITIGLVEFIGEFFVEYDLYTAAAVMAIAPILVLYLILQRFIIEGIATQGMKS
jgi:multiple sugar transport system permease protein